MSYSIRYDLVDDPGRKPRPEDEAARAARKDLAAAIEAHDWAALLGPYFARVCVAEVRREAPSAFSFEFGGESPAAAVTAAIIARIDRVVAGLRKP